MKPVAVTVGRAQRLLFPAEGFGGWGGQIFLRLRLLVGQPCTDGPTPSRLWMAAVGPGVSF